MTERRIDHLEPATIAALVDRTLDADARRAAEAHLAVCADCREIWFETNEMAETAVAERMSEDTGASLKPRWRGWIYAGGGLAAAAAVMLAILLPRMIDRGDRPELRALVEAVGDNRRIEGRLTGGFKWGPVPSATRSGEGPPTVSAQVEIAAGQIRLRNERDRTAATLAALGTAHILTGKLDDAVRALEEAVAMEPPNSRTWSDLSAAYLARSSYPGRDADVPRSLQASEDALRLDPQLMEARFNRAIALERLGMRELAIEAWRAYIRDESEIEWKQEAERRLAELEKSGSVSTAIDHQQRRERLFDEVLSEWGDNALRAGPATGKALDRARSIVSALAEVRDDRLASDVLAAIESSAKTPARRQSLAFGHVEYGRARHAYGRNDFEEAQPLFEAAFAALTVGSSPLAFQARLHLGIIEFRRRQMEAAQRTLSDLSQRLAGAAYPSLEGRARWTLGLLFTFDGRTLASLEQYERARLLLNRSREPRNAAFVDSLIASLQERIGDVEASWHLTLRALNDSAREGTLLAAARNASNRGWQLVALDLQRTAALRATAARNLPNAVDALRSVALTYHRLGQTERARACLREAGELLARREGAAWDRLRAEVDLAIALVTAPASAAEALDASERALAYFSISQTSYRLPEVHVARGRAYVTAGQHERARAELERGLAAYERVGGALPQETTSAEFSDALRSIAGELATIEIRSGRPQEALRLIARVKAIGFGSDPAGHKAIESIAGALPSAASLLVTYTGPSSTFVWTLHAGRTHFREVPVPARELERLVSAAGYPSFSDTASGKIGELLLADLEPAGPGAVLVIVPDGPLHGLPFAVLPGRTRRYLVEERGILISPTVSVPVSLQHRRDALGSVLAVGNPPVDPDGLGFLPLLPGAAQEAVGVGSLYGDATVLIGSKVSRQKMLDLLPASEVFHFAGHALANRVQPEDSMLVVSDGEFPGITLLQIRELRLGRMELAVLAACRTTSGPIGQSSGENGLAAAFLAAGAGAVVSAGWEVDDTSTVRLSLALHRHYIRTRNAARALQLAQIELIATGDQKLSHPRHWGAYSVLGTNVTTNNRKRVVS